MGAQSDFISEEFVPSEDYREQQLVRAQTLIALGIPPEQVASMLSIPLSLLAGKNTTPAARLQQGSRKVEWRDVYFE